MAIATVYSKSIAPYVAKSRFHVVPGKALPLAGFHFLPTPGHSPGHNSIVAYAGNDVLVISGDAWVSKVCSICSFLVLVTMPSIFRFCFSMLCNTN